MGKKKNKHRAQSHVNEDRNYFDDDEFDDLDEERQAYDDEPFPEDEDDYDEDGERGFDVESWREEMVQRASSRERMRNRDFNHGILSNDRRRYRPIELEDLDEDDE